MLQKMTWGAIALLLCLSFAPTAYAQSEVGSTVVEVPNELTPEIARDLVAELSDEQVRGLLLERLDAVAAAQSAAKVEETNPLSDLFYHSTSGAVSVVIDARRASRPWSYFRSKPSQHFLATLG